MVDAGGDQSKRYKHDSRAEEVQEGRAAENEGVVGRFEIYFLCELSIRRAWSLIFPAIVHDAVVHWKTEELSEEHSNALEVRMLVGVALAIHFGVILDLEN